MGSAVADTMDPSALFVVLTDGQDNAQPSGVDVAADIRAEAANEEVEEEEEERESDITIAAVGVGQNVVRRELEMMVDRKKLFVAVERFDEVAKALVRVVHRACPPGKRSWRWDARETTMAEKKPSGGDDGMKVGEEMEEKEEVDVEEEVEVMPSPDADVNGDMNDSDEEEEEEEDGEEERQMASYPSWDGSHTKRGRAGQKKNKYNQRRKGSCHRHGHHMKDSMVKHGKEENYMCRCPCQCGSK